MYYFYTLVCAENEVTVDESENQGSTELWLDCIPDNLHANLTEFRDVTLPPRL